MSDWIPDEDTIRLIRKYAMQNALEYDGKGQAASVQGRILGEVAELRQHAKHLFGVLGPAIEEANQLWHDEGAEAVKAVLEAEAPEALEKRVKERREGLPELPNAVKGDVILRFAPNPNGPLTLGHSRGVIINSQYAEMYNGKMILRFDDTDTKIKRPDLKAYDWIKEDFTWLAGRKPDIILEASERMPEYMAHAKQFIDDDYMYVCKCTADDFKQLRIEQQECPCRANSALKNSDLWNQMNDPEGGFNEGDAVVRVRTGMNHKNPALRDWPALRIQRSPHPKVGEKYRVWPLLDFQSAVEDHIQEVTHIIRGKDLMDSTRKQKLLYEMAGWDYPETLYWGRVKVHEFGGFSTSQMKVDIENGDYNGWDDPRLPTVRALRRRGFSAAAMRKFWIELSLTQKDISVPLATLISHNSTEIDSSTPRLSFIQNPVMLALNCDEIELPDAIDIPCHPLQKEMGVRSWELPSDCGLQVYIEKEDFDIALASDGRIRLKDFADVEVSENKRGKITSMERSDERPIVHWLTEAMATNCILLRPDEKGEQLDDIEGLFEKNSYPNGTIIQLERIGFSRLEPNDRDPSMTQMIWTHT